MSDYQIDRLIDWLYILMYFSVAAVIGVIIILIVGLVVYIKTGVHVKDWLNKF